MKKREHTSIVCDQEESRSYGFQCEKGFTMEHKRGPGRSGDGITAHCMRCMNEGKEDEE